MAKDWQPIDTAPEGIVVDTAIIDPSGGVRSVRPLERYRHLWFMPNGLYLYYTPTHWRDAQRRTLLPPETVNEA